MTGYVSRVRSLLAGVEGETWEARSESPSMDGGNYTFRRAGKAGIIISAHMYGHGLGSARADFIAEAPAAVTHLLARLDAVEALAANWEARGEHDMAYSKTIPDELIAMHLLTNGATMVENARHIRNALRGEGE